MACFFFAGCDGNHSESSPKAPNQAIAQPSDKLIDPEEIIRGAKRMALQGSTRRAIESLSAVDDFGKHTPEAVNVVLDCAVKSDQIPSGWELRLWELAERKLGERPTDIGLKRWLIKLLNQMGHRHHASRHASSLCLQGLANESELLGLINRRRNMPSLPVSQPQGSQREPVANAFPLLQAREAFAKSDFASAQATLQPFVSEPNCHPEWIALYGLILAKGQRFEEMPSWNQSCPKRARDYAEYWSALGHWFWNAGSAAEAVGALLRAAEIDPTSVEDDRLLGACLKTLGKQSLSADFYTRAQANSSLQVHAEMVRGKDAMRHRERICVHLLTCGRPCEFFQWQALMSQIAPNQAEFLNQLNQQRQQVTSDPQFDRLQRESARLGLSRADFAPPTDAQIASLIEKFESEKSFKTGPSIAKAQSVSLVDIATQVGIDFSYLNRTVPALEKILIHETLGGGIGVLDFDLDGRPDLYLAQGSGEPPHEPSKHSDILYRNVDLLFESVTQNASTSDDAYTFGIAVGDVNQDGFPDLYLANLKDNRLLLNQGDGTFLEHSDAIPNHPGLFSSSVAIADISGDHLPDIVELNYVDDPKMYDREKHAGAPPSHFQTAPDRLHINLGNSRFDTIGFGDGAKNAEDLDRSTSSLGIVVTDIDGTTGNEAFVAVDEDRNRYWKRGPNQTFAEVATVSGIAVDGNGVKTAAMGIAAADFNGDGRLDFHVTNFWEQASSLFLQKRGGLFVDRAARYQLATSTFPMVGFGTQASDVNRDGFLDLVILNGHIDDISSMGQPFRMPPQLLLGTANGFEENVFPKADAFWNTPALGRTLAKIDWNQDGKTDFVANHLDRPVSLLENQTMSMNPWMQLELVGTTAERDAVGAVVKVRTQERQFFGWRQAGDGYLCSNEPLIEFAFPESTRYVSLEIKWPDGQSQTFDKVAVDQRYLIVQGQDTLTKR